MVRRWPTFELTFRPIAEQAPSPKKLRSGARWLRIGVAVAVLAAVTAVSTGPATADAPSGFDLVSGTATTDDLGAHDGVTESAIVYETAITEGCAVWYSQRNGVGQRFYAMSSAISGDVGDAIASEDRDFGILFWGGKNDHDANNTPIPSDFNNLGLTYYLSDGSVYGTGGHTWDPGTNAVITWLYNTDGYLYGYDASTGMRAKSTDPLASGTNLYLGFANGHDSVLDSPGTTGRAVTSTCGNTIVSKTDAAVTEWGDTDTFTVVLSSAPSSDVVVSVTSDDTGEVTVSTSPLTFTSGNWNVPQTVTLTGIDDTVADPTDGAIVTVSVVDASSDDDFDAAPDWPIDVSNANDDATPASGYAMGEGYASETEVFARPGEIAYDTPLEVGCAFSYSKKSGFGHRLWEFDGEISGSTVGEAIQAIQDDPSYVYPDYNLLWVGYQQDHDGNTAASPTTEFRNRGWYKNTGSVNWDPIPGDGSDDANYTSQSRMDYDIGDNKTVYWFYDPDGYLYGINEWLDNKVRSDHVLDDGTVLYMSFAPKNSVTRTYPTSITKTCWNVDISSTSVAVAESGSTATFTVVLSNPPDADIEAGKTLTFNVASSDTGEATVDVSTLTFDQANWSTPQTVTVTGIDDSVDDGNQDLSVTLSVLAGTGGWFYDGLPDQVIAVTNADDDAVGFTLSTTSATVTEGGSTTTFTVVLDSEPSSNVVL